MATTISAPAGTGGIWIPDDVLNIIFETIITDPTLDWRASFKFGDVKAFAQALRKQHPCKYIGVCRQWREVINNNRSLWTTILVDPWSLQDFGFNSIEDKVKKHIQKTGDLTLNVVFICGIISRNPESDTITKQRDDQLELLQLLAGRAGEVAARWSTCIVAWQGALRACKTPNPALTFPMPKLTSLCVSSWPRWTFPNDCFAHTPALRHISGDASTIGAWSRHYLSQLFTLETSDPCLTHPFKIIPSAQSITILRLHVKPPRDWQAPYRSEGNLSGVQQICFPRVVEFAAHGAVNAEFLSKFKLDELRSLSLRVEVGLVEEFGPLLAAMKTFASRNIVRLDCSIAQHWTGSDKLVDVMQWLMDFLQALSNVEEVTGSPHFLLAALEAKLRRGWILPRADLERLRPLKQQRKRRKVVRRKDSDSE
jgi:hypothetical protein